MAVCVRVQLWKSSEYSKILNIANVIVNVNIEVLQSKPVKLKIKCNMKVKVYFTFLTLCCKFNYQRRRVTE